MLRVGLTGGIGAGKSTVAARLVEHGAVLIDSDVIAREVVAVGTEGLAEVAAAFGPGVLTGEGALDRAGLAKIVFGDGAALATLNGIVHPRVRARSAELVAGAAADAVLVHDVPLLVENGMAPAFHLVIVVDAPAEARVRRLVGRGLGEEDARARIAAQATDEQRRAAADVWLDNGGRPEEVQAAADALWAERLVPFEANVRLGRAAGHLAVLADPDPTWPDQAGRLAARIALAAGGRRVDHIGSTSVPGLAAEDVLDLQLTVHTPDEADSLTEALTGAGFPCRPGSDSADTTDIPHPAGADPDGRRERRHGAADPGRPANLYVRVAGSPAWRLALLFPAWLRADPAARAEYLAVSRAATEDERGHVTAKEPWLAGAARRAQDWADATGWSPP